MGKCITKRLRSEFGLTKSEALNGRRAAERKLNSFLKKNGLFFYQKFPNIQLRVADYRLFHKMEPTMLSKKESILFIMDCFLSDEENPLKRSQYAFYSSEKWILLRYKVIDKYGAKCMKCGSHHQIEVDHIKPRSLYPELELDFDNMQVLCKPCNSAKSNRVIVDYRDGLLAPVLRKKKPEPPKMRKLVNQKTGEVIYLPVTQKLKKAQ